MADSGPLDETALDETSGAAATTGRGKAELREIERERYELGAEVGRGGLGRVVAARDVYLERAVAIKELVDTDEHARRRFVREALITARLQHPSIVPVYDAGRWPDRAPFYAMKLVAGRPLLGAIGDATTLAARLALVPTVLAVADAVAYAHSEHIVHRDLKPQNVLVGSFGETVVIDWGLAKDLATDDIEALDAGPYRAANSDQTVAGAVLGTPAYMPPEQATGEDVDERADVYALGAMLYHVISGRAPHVGDSVDKMIEQITEGTIEPLIAIEKRVPADLAAIVAKAMARDRSARYADAKELASDLRRFTTGQLVAVYRYTPGERVLRFLRRYRAVVAVAATALVVLAVFGWWSLRAIMRESGEAEIRAEEAIANFNHAMVARARAAVRSDPDEALALLARLDPQGPDWDAARVLAADALSQPRLEHLIAATPIGAEDWQSLNWHTIGSKLIGFENHTIAVFDLAHDTVTEIDATKAEGWQWFTCANPDQLIGIDFRVDSRAVGKLALSTGAIEVLSDRDVWRPYEACTDHVLFEHLFPIDDTLDWWDPVAKQRKRLVDHGVVQVWSTHDGKHALVRDTRRMVTWFEPATGKRVELGIVEGGQSVSDPELSDDGSFAIFPGHPTKILQIGKPPRTDTADVVGMSRDGTMLAFANRTETDTPIVFTDGALANDGGVGITGRLGQLAFGEHFLHGFGDRSTMWELATHARFELLETSIQRVDFPLAGDRLARWSADGTLRVWRLQRSTILAAPRGKLTVLSRNGRWSVTLDGAETRRIDLHHEVPDEVYPSDGPVPGYVLPDSVADDGSAIIGASSGYVLWRTGQRPIATGVLVPHFFWAGTRAFAVSATQVIELGATPRTIVDLPAGKPLVAVANDLRTVGVVDPNTGVLHVVDVASKRDDVVPASTSNAQFSGAGSLIAAPSADQRSVIVWNVGARTSRVYPFASAHPRLFVFSADERQLAVAGDSIIVVIDLEHGRVRTLATQGDQVTDLAFDPAGARLAAGTTSEARLYDLASGEVRVVAAAYTMAMRFDGDRLVVSLPFATIAATPDLPSDPFVLSGLLRAQPFQLVKGELRRKQPPDLR